eukprot:gene32152-16683_t
MTAHQALQLVAYHNEDLFIPDGSAIKGFKQENDNPAACWSHNVDLFIPDGSSIEGFKQGNDKLKNTVQKFKRRLAAAAEYAAAMKRAQEESLSKEYKLDETEGGHMNSCIKGEEPQQQQHSQHGLHQNEPAHAEHESNDINGGEQSPLEQEGHIPPKHTSLGHVPPKHATPGHVPPKHATPGYVPPGQVPPEDCGSLHHLTGKHKRQQQHSLHPDLTGKRKRQQQHSPHHYLTGDHKRQQQHSSPVYINSPPETTAEQLETGMQGEPFVKLLPFSTPIGDAQGSLIKRAPHTYMHNLRHLLAATSGYDEGHVTPTKHCSPPKQTYGIECTNQTDQVLMHATRAAFPSTAHHEGTAQEDKVSVDATHTASPRAVHHVGCSSPRVQDTAMIDSIHTPDIFEKTIDATRMMMKSIGKSPGAEVGTGPNSTTPPDTSTPLQQDRVPTHITSTTSPKVTGTPSHRGSTPFQTQLASPSSRPRASPPSAPKSASSPSLVKSASSPSPSFPKSASSQEPRLPSALSSGPLGIPAELHVGKPVLDFTFATAGEGRGPSMSPTTRSHEIAADGSHATVQVALPDTSPSRKGIDIVSQQEYPQDHEREYSPQQAGSINPSSASKRASVREGCLLSALPEIPALPERQAASIPVLSEEKPQHTSHQQVGSINPSSASKTGSKRASVREGSLLSALQERQAAPIPALPAEKPQHASPQQGSAPHQAPADPPTDDSHATIAETGRKMQSGGPGAPAKPQGGVKPPTRPDKSAERPPCEADGLKSQSQDSVSQHPTCEPSGSLPPPRETFSVHPTWEAGGSLPPPGESVSVHPTCEAEGSVPAPGESVQKQSPRYERVIMALLQALCQTTMLEDKRNERAEPLSSHEQPAEAARHRKGGGIPDRLVQAADATKPLRRESTSNLSGEDRNPSGDVSRKRRDREAQESWQFFQQKPANEGSTNPAQAAETFADYDNVSDQQRDSGSSFEVDEDPTLQANVARIQQRISRTFQTLLGMSQMGQEPHQPHQSINLRPQVRPGHLQHLGERPRPIRQSHSHRKQHTNSTQHAQFNMQGQQGQPTWLPHYQEHPNKLQKLQPGSNPIRPQPGSNPMKLQPGSNPMRPRDLSWQAGLKEIFGQPTLKASSNLRPLHRKNNCVDPLPSSSTEKDDSKSSPSNSPSPSGLQSSASSFDGSLPSSLGSPASLSFVPTPPVSDFAATQNPGPTGLGRLQTTPQSRAARPRMDTEYMSDDLPLPAQPRLNLTPKTQSGVKATTDEQCMGEDVCEVVDYGHQSNQWGSIGLKKSTDPHASLRPLDTPRDRTSEQKAVPATSAVRPPTRPPYMESDQTLPPMDQHRQAAEDSLSSFSFGAPFHNSGHLKRKQKTSLMNDGDTGQDDDSELEPSRRLRPKIDSAQLECLRSAGQQECQPSADQQESLKSVGQQERETSTGQQEFLKSVGQQDCQPSAGQQESLKSVGQQDCPVLVGEQEFLRSTGQQGHLRSASEKNRARPDHQVHTAAVSIAAERKKHYHLSPAPPTKAATPATSSLLPELLDELNREERQSFHFLKERHSDLSKTLHTGDHRTLGTGDTSLPDPTPASSPANSMGAEAYMQSSNPARPTLRTAPFSLELAHDFNENQDMQSSGPKTLQPEGAHRIPRTEWPPPQPSVLPSLPPGTRRADQLDQGMHPLPGPATTTPSLNSIDARLQGPSLTSQGEDVTGSYLMSKFEACEVGILNADERQRLVQQCTSFIMERGAFGMNAMGAALKQQGQQQQKPREENESFQKQHSSKKPGVQFNAKQQQQQQDSVRLQPQHNNQQTRVGIDHHMGNQVQQQQQQQEQQDSVRLQPQHNQQQREGMHHHMGNLVQQQQQEKQESARFLNAHGSASRGLHGNAGMEQCSSKPRDTVKMGAAGWRASVHYQQEGELPGSRPLQDPLLRRPPQVLPHPHLRHQACTQEEQGRHMPLQEEACSEGKHGMHLTPGPSLRPSRLDGLLSKDSGQAVQAWPSRLDGLLSKDHGQAVQAWPSRLDGLLSKEKAPACTASALTGALVKEKASTHQASTQNRTLFPPPDSRHTPDAEGEKRSATFASLYDLRKQGERSTDAEGNNARPPSKAPARLKSPPAPEAMDLLLQVARSMEAMNGTTALPHGAISLQALAQQVAQIEAQRLRLLGDDDPGEAILPGAAVRKPDSQQYTSTLPGAAVRKPDSQQYTSTLPGAAVERELEPPAQVCSDSAAQTLPNSFNTTQEHRTGAKSVESGGMSCEHAPISRAKEKPSSGLKPVDSGAISKANVRPRRDLKPVESGAMSCGASSPFVFANTTSSLHSDRNADSPDDGSTGKCVSILSLFEGMG